ncbi:exosortase A [Croceicoccus estronivorus]|nr:exosortase A [Croceicoccus estronivorus]
MPGQLWGRLSPVWRMPAARLLCVWTALIAVFWRDWADMAWQWWDSSTYNHVLLVPAILIWLVALRREELLKMQPRAWWWGLLPFAGALFVWLLGAFSGLNVARQLGAVLMLQAAVLALLGPRVAIGLLFPLAYMFFLVPFGDELVPALQTITAKITIALTHWSGIPADIDGVFIDTPVGLFEVAEACSGVKFLIAMIALGTLVAHICFKGWRRRFAFMAVCVILPIVANGVRAWGTIYIAQFRGVEFAAGFDHIFYGWIFFALVMAAVLALAWRFFDRAVDDPFISADRLEHRTLPRVFESAYASHIRLISVGGALVVLTLFWAAMAARLSAEMPKQIFLPNVPGWQRVDYEPTVWWEPHAHGADHRLLGSYRDRNGHQVDVFFALYPDQNEGNEAGGYGQGALMPESPWSWIGVGQTMRGAQSERLLAQGQSPGAVERLAVTWYRNGSLLTGSKARLKLATMEDRLLLRDHATILLILSAENRGDPSAQESLESFLSTIGPVGEWMDRTADLP